jgi:hypothetical protein
MSGERRRGGTRVTLGQMLTRLRRDRMSDGDAMRAVSEAWHGRRLTLTADLIEHRPDGSIIVCGRVGIDPADAALFNEPFDWIQSRAWRQTGGALLDYQGIGAARSEFDAALPAKDVGGAPTRKDESLTLARAIVEECRGKGKKAIISEVATRLGLPWRTVEGHLRAFKVPRKRPAKPVLRV